MKLSIYNLTLTKKKHLKIEKNLIITMIYHNIKNY